MGTGHSYILYNYKPGDDDILLTQKSSMGWSSGSGAVPLAYNYYASLSPLVRNLHKEEGNAGKPKYMVYSNCMALEWEARYSVSLLSNSWYRGYRG